MTPAPGMVLVKMLEEDSIVASTDRNYERIAEVLTLPENDFGEVNGVQKGDIIFFDEYAYRRFNYKGEEYCIVNISEPGSLWGVIHASSEG